MKYPLDSQFPEGFLQQSASLLLTVLIHCGNLRGDENIFPLESDIRQNPFQRLANEFLILVHVSRVNQPVSLLDGDPDCPVYRFLGQKVKNNI